MKALCRKAVEQAVTKEVVARDSRWCPSCQNVLQVREGEWTCVACSGRIVSFLTVKRLFGDVLMSYIIEQIQPYMEPIYGRLCPVCKKEWELRWGIMANESLSRHTKEHK